MKNVKPKKEYHATLYVVQNGEPVKQELDKAVFSRWWLAELWFLLMLFHYSDVTLPGFVHLETNVITVSK